MSVAGNHDSTARIRGKTKLDAADQTELTLDVGEVFDALDQFDGSTR